MGFIGMFQAGEGEYFQYRKAVKFMSEVLLAISTITAICSTGTLVGLGIQLQKEEESKEPTFAYNEMPYKDVVFALFIYTIVILIVSLSDIFFLLILRIGIRKLKISYCLFWRGATVTSLVVAGMLTLAFITMIRDIIIVLGYLPSLISKPFSLWLVNGFINELGEMRTFPDGNTMMDIERMKQCTTIFYKNKRCIRKYSQNPYVIPTTLKPIPE